MVDISIVADTIKINKKQIMGDYMELYENEVKPQRVLLVCVDTGDYDAQSSLDELWELAESAGAVPVATLTQKKEKIGRASCRERV